MSPFYLQEAYENMEYFAEYTKSGDISSMTLTFENFFPARARTRRFWFTLDLPEMEYFAEIHQIRSHCLQSIDF